MSAKDCDRIRDVLPEWILGTMGPELGIEMTRHLASCPDCRREEEVLRRLLSVRPTPPEGLAARIQARLKEEVGTGLEPEAPKTAGDVIPLFRRHRWTPTWALSAAAVVILSLGIGIVWNGAEIPEVGQSSGQVASEDPAPEAWLWDDGMVAGAPVYDGLTDDQLEALIEELEG
jgi:anti-sigma factor RsiW